MKVCLLFYRSFFLASNLVTISCAALLVEAQNPFFISVLLTGKLATNIILALYLHFFHSQELYFFHNIGYSKLQLYGYSFGLDFLLWIITMIVTTTFFL